MIPRILDMLFLSAPHLAGDGVRQRSEERRRYRFSIHAALAGGDNLVILAAMLDTSFYPRHPRGWRPGTADSWQAGLAVSIHATSRVATPLGEFLVGSFLRFYPRHPRGWRPVSVCHNAAPPGVSIHATLAGGDTEPTSAPTNTRPFLSTPPSRVATICFCAA